MTALYGDDFDQDPLFDATPHRPAPDGIKGVTEPRLFTPPLRKLHVGTSKGYEVIRFARDQLGIELYPWQKWWLIHALELNEQGRFRFRTVLTLVGRQSGKTRLLQILTLWMLCKRPGSVVLGAAQSMDIARNSWSSTVDLAETHHKIYAQVDSIKRGNTDTSMTMINRSRYRIAATRQGAGRGLSVDLMILDELREQKDWTAWSALSKTVIAKAQGLVVAISNAGEADSVVLNQLRASGINRTDPSIGLFEWSGVEGCELDDWDQIAQACPGLGYAISPDAILTSMGTDPPPVFRTEILCQTVEAIDSPISAQAWNACADPAGSGVMSMPHKWFCLDVSQDGDHATVAAAALTDSGRVRLGIVGGWNDLARCVHDLPGLLEEYKPEKLAWFPGGPAAALLADISTLRTGRMSSRFVEIKSSEIPAVCQGFAQLVTSRGLIHGNDPLLNAHALGSRRLPVGDGWRFTRRMGNVDAAYAASGAVHLARTAKPPARLQLITAKPRKPAS